jgi:hypothetical protein
MSRIVIVIFIYHRVFVMCMVGIVHSRTQTMEFFFYLLLY